MRKPEQRLWDTMKSNRPMQVRLERIENGVGNGTADVHGTARGVTAWFELKQLNRPKKDSTRFLKKNTVRVAQRAWHREYAHHGGRSYLLIRDDQRQLYLVPGGEIHLVMDFAYDFFQKRYRCDNWQELFIHAFRPFP